MHGAVKRLKCVVCRGMSIKRKSGLCVPCQRSFKKHGILR